MEAVTYLAERRNLQFRRRVIDCVVEKVLRNPRVVFTVEMVRLWCDIPREGAQRIAATLAHGGLIREIKNGVFSSGAWPGAGRVQPLSS
jgi:hypothetical protein